MSTEKGASDIGKFPGFAMATSEDMRPVPSVEEPEGADIPTKGDVSLRLITCFTGLPTTNTQKVDACFLSQCNTVV